MSKNNHNQTEALKVATAIDFSKPLETAAGEPVKYVCHDVIEYKCARVCVDQATGVVYSSPYIGMRIRNVAEQAAPQQVPQPTYYVRHPDDSYSVANPQPVTAQAHRQESDTDLLPALQAILECWAVEGLLTDAVVMRGQAAIGGADRHASNRDKALEDAAKACEAQIEPHDPDSCDDQQQMLRNFNVATRDCIRAIRALKGQPSAPADQEGGK